MTESNIFLSKRGEIEGRVPLSQSLEDASEVYFMALNGIGLWIGGLKAIQECWRGGNKVKFYFIFVDPEGGSAREITRNKIKGNKVNPMEEGLTRYCALCKDDHFKENTKCYVTKINIPYSMMIVKKKSGSKYIKVDLISIDTDNHERPSFVVPESNKEWQDFFMKQWETVVRSKQTRMIH